MEYEVIVVGAGIGGLTTAALLAARGVNVCVFERQSHVGGCVANFEQLGYTFEPTGGLYSGWEAGGTWDDIFSALSVPPPSLTKVSPNYVVRLPDGREVAISPQQDALEAAISSAFPECVDTALNLIRHVKGNTVPTRPSELLVGASREFRWFIDAQLQMFAQSTSDSCSPQRAAEALRLATGDLWSMDLGAQALADSLATSLKASGGTLRLDSPVLRFAYGTEGTPNGVDLLSGERVNASRAMISNLTAWDTYGKLIGPGRTPREVTSALKKMSAWGAFLMFLSIDETAAEKLPAPHALLVSAGDADPFDPEHQLLSLNLTNAPNSAPPTKRAMTVISFTQADEWFSFHEDHSWHEEKDQAALETAWARLHRALPQLGDSVEVIETSTPQTVYESTRRRLGMIGSPSGNDGAAPLSRPFPNVFLVGDTVADGLGLAGTASTALKITRQVLSN